MEQLPEFEMSSEEAPPSPPKRQRKKPAKKAPAAPKKRKVANHNVQRATPGPKRARKKRMPRRLPGRVVEAAVTGGPPNVSPEAAGVIRAYMALGEADRAVVSSFIQALR